ncbi:MAG: cell division protein ZapE [Dehalococcoidia bacterium]
MTPLERYQRERARPDFIPDQDQALVISKLDALHREIVTAADAAPGAWRRVLTWLGHEVPRTTAKGLYLHGGVGRGKTFVVDMFCACLPRKLCERVHFHSFMREVHGELKRLRGVQDPLREVAARWARDLRVLCLDEFHVVDITDAMLLAQLLDALFTRGVTLVTTSNEAPDELYRGGLQRDRFLPAIRLLKEHLEIFEFTGQVDYRWRTLTQAATYYTPNDATAERALRDRFEALTHRTPETAPPLNIEGREIPVLALADGVAWFEFASLCEGPRSTHDYIELACCFHTVLVSGVPRFRETDNDAARRFVNLVDEFYDRGVNLLLSAAVPPEELYAQGRLAAAFRRTASRLTEMQTEEYLAKPHVSEVTSLSKSDN